MSLVIFKKHTKDTSYSDFGLMILYEADAKSNWSCCRITILESGKSNLVFHGKELIKMNLIDLLLFFSKFDKKIELETDRIRFNEIGLLLGGQGLRIESNYHFSPDYISLEKID